MKLFSKISIGIVFGMLLFCGCESTKQPSNITSFSAFNDQTYVWESFIYTTNKVERK